jgi:DNA-binding SARP family transcriptional activator
MLLGSWQLVGAQCSLEVGNNGQRLLALLALRGRCDRSYVSGVLWPECSEQHAAGNLRATLSRLRRRNLISLLDTWERSLWLRPEVSVDAQELSDTATAVLDGASARPRRRVLHTLTSDDLLMGWYDDWVLLERERLRQLRLHALEALSAQLLRSGDAASAVEAGLAAVAIEPLRESAHRAVIRAHLAEGNRGDALRQYEQLRRVLQAELGAEPSALVSDLLE